MTSQPLRKYQRHQRANPEDAGNSGHVGHVGHVGHQAPLLQRWMSGHQRNDLWQLYDTRNFADLWYGARTAGERLRALTLERLYRNRPHPGGPHPDPREPAAFSSQAVLSVAAYLVGLQLDATDAGAFSSRAHVHEATYEHEDAYEKDDDYDEETGQRLPYAWIMTYAEDEATYATYAQDDPDDEDIRPPQIVLRTLHGDRLRMEFEIACLIGYWHRDHARLSDPDAPTGAILLPPDPGVTTLLHQYAIALLGLTRDCPEHWPCHCNRIRRRFNAPPPDHLQPTGQLTTAELLAEAEQARAAREARRERRNTEPKFPYPDPNRWTQEE